MLMNDKTIFDRYYCTLHTVDANEFVTAQIDRTFHEGRVEWRAVR